MKILQICAAYKPAYSYGGPTMSVSMLSEELQKAGISVQVFATTANGKTELPVTPGMPVNVDGVSVTYFKRLTKDHTHFSPALFKKLWKEARSFDIIHIHAWWNLVSLFSCLVALLRGMPVVVSPRGTLSAYSFQNKNIGVKWLIHHLLGKPLLKRSHIHVTSGNEAAAIENLVKAKSLVNLPNFVKLPEETATGDRQPGVFRLIFFSRIEEKKGLDILLNALPLLTFPYTLTIAGDGDINYINSLKTLIAAKGIDANINWAGFQSDEKFKLLHAHDLLVLPSHDENFGNVIIESLSEGTAVLVSPHVGLADYVTQKKFGWESEASATALAEKISLVHGQQGALEFVRLNAPRKIRDDFSEELLVRQYMTMYEKIIEN